jgi:hypothetical protein
MTARALTGIAASIVLCATGCNGSGEKQTNTPSEVKRAFTAEGVQLAVWPSGVGDDDRVTSFVPAQNDDGLLVSVFADSSAAEKDADQLRLVNQLMSGKPSSEAPIVRAGNVLMISRLDTPHEETAAGKRAMKRLHGSTGN